MDTHHFVHGSRPGHPDRPADNGVARTTVMEFLYVCAGTVIPAPFAMV